MRPGNSRTIARACGLMVTKETSGSFGWVATEAIAWSGSLQPAKSGARAASTTAMAAGDARSPDMESGIPEIRRH